MHVWSILFIYYIFYIYLYTDLFWYVGRNPRTFCSGNPANHHQPAKYDNYVIITIIIISIIITIIIIFIVNVVISNTYSYNHIIASLTVFFSPFISSYVTFYLIISNTINIHSTLLLDLYLYQHHYSKSLTKYNQRQRTSFTTDLTDAAVISGSSLESRKSWSLLLPRDEIFTGSVLCSDVNTSP